MLFGPFTKIEVTAIVDLLSAEGKACEVIDDVSLHKEQEHTYQGHNNYGIDHWEKNFPRTLFTEIKSEDLLVVKGLLLQYGFEIKPQVSEIDFDAKDYICPICKYSLTSPGSCETHKDTQLVLWNDYIKKETEKKYKRYSIIGYFLFGAIALFFLYVYLRPKF